MFTVGPTFWSLCSLVALVAAPFAMRSSKARLAGRIAVGVLMLVGGALFNAIQLAVGSDYSGFADPAHFRWVADAWEAVVPANHVLLIGLLVLFEAIVGVLILSGGRRTQLGYVGAIAFHSALWLFGWIETVYVLLMLPALILLLLAERRAAAAPAPPPAVSAPVGSATF